MSDTTSPDTVSGFATNDGNDLDVRYLQPQTEATKTLVCNALLTRIGVQQETPLTGTTSPYTLPIDAFVIFTAKRTGSGDFWGDAVVKLSMYVNDELVYTGTKTAGYGVTVAVEKTIEGFYKAGTVFKATSSSSNDNNGAFTFKVIANPYSLYKIE